MDIKKLSRVIDSSGSTPFESAAEDTSNAMAALLDTLAGNLGNSSSHYMFNDPDCDEQLEFIISEALLLRKCMKDRNWDAYFEQIERYQSDELGESTF